ncbi:MAG: SpoIIE family protein phosphatase [Planctomycetota bacterium]
MNAPYTSEFHHEFASQTRRLLRRRFIWFTAVIGGFGLITLSVLLLAFVLSLQQAEDPDAEQFADAVLGDVSMIMALLVSVLSTLFYLGSLIFVVVWKPRDAWVLRLSFILVILDGVFGLMLRQLGGDFWGMHIFAISYTVAAVFLPWSVRQALIPAITVVGSNTVLRLAGLYPENMTAFSLLGIVWSLLGAASILPGLTICWWRQSSRLRSSQFSFIQRRYGEVRRELTDARRIHEAMFPAPRNHGEVRFTYRYQPMRQIGGDYLHVAHSPTDCGTGERLCVVVLDVTGHGIPAALNVNRLYGELARVFGEDPCIEPGEVLRLLNRYVRLTMSSHSVYVTGLAVRVDPVRGVLEYANAGHPPAFHIGVDGTIDQIDSTTFLLGAVEDIEFEPNTRRQAFSPGDRLVAYTDGATEAQNEDGRMLGIRGMQGLLASQTLQSEGAWPPIILSAVDAHRDGPPADDTLIIEVFRPASAAGARRTPLTEPERAGPAAEAGVSL